MKKTIWMLWLQGWDEAPAIVQACHASWQRKNPGWDIQALDLETLQHALPKETLNRIFATDKAPEAISDQIRIELLGLHGGVWADASTLCVVPLDSWLYGHMASGFFAFERPIPERMIASWFLASTEQNYIIAAWRDVVRAYWRGRDVRHDYFWFHQLFGALYDADPGFKQMWDVTPTLPAAHPMHFAPEDSRLYEPPTPMHLQCLKTPPSPVFKLTHKLRHAPQPGALIEILCRFGRGELT